MRAAQLFATYMSTLHIADPRRLFFVEVPVSQDADLPAERNAGNPEMVALLTALSQVCSSFPLCLRE